MPAQLARASPLEIALLPIRLFLGIFIHFHWETTAADFFVLLEPAGGRLVVAWAELLLGDNWALVDLKVHLFIRPLQLLLLKRCQILRLHRLVSCIQSRLRGAEVVQLLLDRHGRLDLEVGRRVRRAAYSFGAIDSNRMLGCVTWAGHLRLSWHVRIIALRVTLGVLFSLLALNRILNFLFRLIIEKGILLVSVGTLVLLTKGSGSVTEIIFLVDRFTCI